jgi:hypothetical protein
MYTKFRSGNFMGGNNLIKPNYGSEDDSEVDLREMGSEDVD